MPAVPANDHGPGFCVAPNSPGAETSPTTSFPAGPDVPTSDERIGDTYWKSAALAGAAELTVIDRVRFGTLLTPFETAIEQRTGSITSPLKVDGTGFAVIVSDTPFGSGFPVAVTLHCAATHPISSCLSLHTVITGGASRSTSCPASYVGTAVSAEPHVHPACVERTTASARILAQTLKPLPYYLASDT